MRIFSMLGYRFAPRFADLGDQRFCRADLPTAAPRRAVPPTRRSGPPPDVAPALLPNPATGTATMANAVNAQSEITGWAEALDGSRRALVRRPAPGSS
ncbi:hypothetical protein ACWCSD_41300 [Nonomuraea sp. NPDC001684]